MSELKNLISGLPKSWKDELGAQVNKTYFKELEEFLESQYSQDKTIYPPKKNIFEAFKVTDLEKIKVVILGQDPYHGYGQAHGLCFSVNKNIKLPPSLKNIYKELNLEFDYPIPTHGDLHAWARQGVLLLNTVLTVEEEKPASHQKKGWEDFTDKIINLVASKNKNIVFMLWGSHAQKKIKTIDKSRHLILKAPHPSPLSAYRGFFNCEHFIKCNEYLKKYGKEEINWRIK